jgi:hypothetical protein
MSLLDSLTLTKYNKEIFDQLSDKSALNLCKTQGYIPFINRFPKLQSSIDNYTELSHKWTITSVNNSVEVPTNVKNCTITNTAGNSCNDNVFFKPAPLLDPYKYLHGKYKETHISTLPSFSPTENLNVHPKMLNTDNASYTDCFFCYISAKLLEEFGFIHGIPYYGSFLAIKNDFKVDISDDLEYLIDSEFFIKNKGKKYQVDDYSHMVIDSNGAAKPSLMMEDDVNISSAIMMCEDIPNYDEIFERSDVVTPITQTNTYNYPDVNDHIEEIIDIDKNKNPDEDDMSNDYGYSSSMSSNSSSEEDEDEINSDLDECEDTDNSDNGDTSTEYSTLCEDEEIFATINQFPVQIICMGYCNGTLDSLIQENKFANDEEWFSAFMQIIMILITYNELFSFTHNDLHSNNVMFVPTREKYICYLYKGNYYKVPTFGRIFKIIDFGRAIYKIDGQIFCSDSYHPSGDAFSQYNTDPYFNPKKPRIDPNPSFDLCRLGCSLIDYFFDSTKEFDTDKIAGLSPLKKIIIEWCSDDDGLNVVYNMKTGEDRYHNFDLYKKIARTVHGHSPHSQLDRSEFKQYKIKKAPKEFSNKIICIDKYVKILNQQKI